MKTHPKWPRLVHPGRQHEGLLLRERQEPLHGCAVPEGAPQLCRCGRKMEALGVNRF